MVDAIDVALGEHAAQRVVHLPRRLQVLADRLLHHQPRALAHQLALAQLPGDHREQLRRGGQIAHPYPVLALVQDRRQFRPALVRPHIDRDIEQPFAEPPQSRPVDLLLAHARMHRLARGGTEFLVRVGPAGNAYDPRGLRDLARQVAVIQRRQQLARRQVAAGAEHHDIERLHGDHPRGHGAKPFSASRRRRSHRRYRRSCRCRRPST